MNEGHVEWDILPCGMVLLYVVRVSVEPVRWYLMRWVYLPLLLVAY